MQNSMVKNYIYASLSALSLICLLAIAFAFAPVKEYQLIHTVDIKGNSLTVDRILSTYIIDDENQLQKFSKDGELVARFSENRYGKLTSVDATSPFNILLFYKDFATIVATDNQLNPRTLYRLASIGMNNISAVALSDDNYIWVFDRQESKLKKVNTKYEVIQESLALNSLLGVDIDPTFMIERDRRVFVSDPELGILIFDIFGNYYNSIPVTDLEYFQVFNNNLIFYQDGDVKLMDLADFQVRSIPLPSKITDIQQLHLEKERLYVLTDKQLQIYEGK